MSPSLRAVLAALVVSVVAVGAAPSLSVKTSIPNVEVDGLENLKVTVTIFNTDDETLKLLNDPRGVLSPFPENSFTITNVAGSRPLFNGPKVTYSSRYVASFNYSGVFTILAPGASINVTHDLSDAYNFTRSGAGNYSIEPSDLFTYVELSGNLAVSRVHDKRAASYKGCTDDNKRVIAAASSRAQEYADNAYSYLKSKSGVTDRYRFWFGHYTDSRKRTVQERFRSIKDHRFSGFTYDCYLCIAYPQFQIYAAFVARPEHPGVINICPFFWERPETGANSRVGTLIHEASHFTGTFDLADGEKESERLARASPDDAIINADNCAFFAENTPFLP